MGFRVYSAYYNVNKTMELKNLSNIGEKIKELLSCVILLVLAWTCG